MIDLRKSTFRTAFVWGCSRRWWRLSKSSITILAIGGLAVSVSAIIPLVLDRISPAIRVEAPSFQIDLDRADEATLALLPGIGPVLAARIVEDRNRLGAFGGIAGLNRVRGIGPAISAGIEPFVLTEARRK
ncbi:MAG: helix-hairpin-helix domain-containing protein [Planctomycetota bacterium]|nr:helix-hairpin-helix domain-containing protein [Planctomycetota bacterium]MDA1262163.1 helix-hairpin-helix domain-containing protein [Planctomycetota bacterium]